MSRTGGSAAPMLPDGKIDGEIRGERVVLRPLDPAGDLSRYCAWMNDPETVRYLEARFRSFDRPLLVDYIRRMNDSPDQLLLGIHSAADGRHVGNIKLGPIDWRHRRGDIGILIGEAAARGRGFAGDAVRALTRHAFRTLELHKVTASCYAVNDASRRLFERAGFGVEAVRREHHFCDGAWTDIICLAAFGENFDAGTAAK